MTSKLPIARVVLFKQVNQPLDYSIPDALIGLVEPGMRVVVPVRDREAAGMVIELAQHPQVVPVRPLLGLLDDSPLVDRNFLELTRRVADYYLAGRGSVIRSALPPGLDASPRVLYRLTEEGRAQLETPGRLHESHRVLLELLNRTPSARRGLSSRTLRRRPGSAAPASALRSLIQKGWIEQRTVHGRLRGISDAAAAGPGDRPRGGSLPLPFPVSDETSRLITGADNGNRPRVFCVRGPVLEALFSFLSSLATELIGKKQGLLILVPEVTQAGSLASFLAAGLERPVAVYHGELTPGVRTATWRAIASGDFSVVVGTRSAVFAPVKSLGLLVVCLEEDPSHKAEESPHYHVREVALMRGEIGRVPVCLTSVSQSLETYDKCRSDRFRVLNTGVFPEPVRVSIVDMKSTPPGRILSGELSAAVSKQLRSKRPVMLLLNRKGYSTALLCRDCGGVFRCSQCGVSLVFHRQARRLICHYCGIRQPPPTVCGSCKGTRIGGIGMGTEQVEESLHQAFPGARILRVEKDDPPASAKKADIYLGTEWIYRWADGPDPSLVGILDADTYLYSPDFYATERTFHFIAQVMARAGRRRTPGKEVWIQTRYPDHPGITWARENDPDLFYKMERFERKVLGYPPFTRLVSIIMRSRHESEASKMAHRVKNRLMEALSGQNGFHVLGPAPARLSPLRGMYRFVLLVKGPTDSSLQNALRGVFLETGRGTETPFTVIVDPMGIR